MGMFIGTYQHSVDSKGRLIVPVKFRDRLGEKFVVTRGLDACLFVFPLEEWANQEKELRNLPATHREARAYNRLFFSGAVECELDGQGRIMLPPHLRDYARIDKDVVLIGVSTRVEIWSQAVWEEYSKTVVDSYEEIAERIVGLGT